MKLLVIVAFKDREGTRVHSTEKTRSREASLPKVTQQFLQQIVIHVVF